MRLFFISFLIALLGLLPAAAAMENLIPPGWLLTAARLPSACLGYMTVFFHEIGHTIAAWSYGQPAVPAFNFSDGGGLSLPLMERSLALQGMIYLIAFGGLWLCWKKAFYRALPVAAVLLLAHMSFAFGDRYQDAVSYMGHGGAVLAGCFCIWRAVMHRTEKTYGAAERYLNMTFGLFAVMDNLLMSYGLITNDIARTVYAAGIGCHLTNDFTAIALRMDADIRHVAAFSLAFTATAAAATAALCLRGLRHGD